MKLMYIAVLDEVPDHIVPVLIAHSVLNADQFFRTHEDWSITGEYYEWMDKSFRKVVLRVNRKEFEKIRTTLTCWEGHENTTLDGETSCLVVLPVDRDNKPNVLKFAKMWKPKESV